MKTKEERILKVVKQLYKLQEDYPNTIITIEKAGSMPIKDMKIMRGIASDIYIDND